MPPGEELVRFPSYVKDIRHDRHEHIQAHASSWASTWLAVFLLPWVANTRCRASPDMHASLACLADVSRRRPLARLVSRHALQGRAGCAVACGEAQEK